MPDVLTRHHLHADQLWAAATLGLAVVGAVLAVAGAYDAGAVAGLAAVLIGGWSQLVSRTRFERWESVTGVVLGALVLAVCLAYGSGLSLDELPEWTGVS